MSVLLDVRGKQCPIPVIETKKALQKIDGKDLEVIVDNAIAVQNLLKLGKYLRLECSSKKEEEKLYRVYFKTSGADNGAIAAADTSEECIVDAVKKGKLVVLSADHMGEGDDVLGRLLMKGFVYALTELDELPETILLYNGGAKLSVTGSDSLEDLQSLESQGVEILTCGTCLNHYGLSDKLAVGEVTNMYAIAEKMTKASGIIKP